MSREPQSSRLRVPCGQDSWTGTPPYWCANFIYSCNCFILHNIYVPCVFGFVAGPAPSTKDQQTFTVNDELMLQCNDLSASPQVEVEWSFKPSGEAPPQGKDPLSIGSFFKQERNNIFMCVKSLADFVFIKGC